MNYDKNSFLAGIAVGQRLKGWATAASGGDTPTPPPGPTPTPSSDERPADWLVMPTPAANEAYLLVQAPPGASCLVGLTIAADSYSLSIGTSDASGQYIEWSAYSAPYVMVDESAKTSEGLLQALIKVSASNLTNFVVSANRAQVLEIAANLPSVITLNVQNCTAMQYFALYGSNNIYNGQNLFYNCYSLKEVFALDVSTFGTIFNAFYNCYSLKKHPKLNAPNVTNAGSLYVNCVALDTVPALYLPIATQITSMFSGCRQLKSVVLNAPAATSASGLVSGCPAIESVEIVIQGQFPAGAMQSPENLKAIKVTSEHTGQVINLTNATRLTRPAILELFDSISGAGRITLNTALQSMLSDADIAIATGKGWTVEWAM